MVSAQRTSSCTGKALAQCPPWTWPPATSVLLSSSTLRLCQACALPFLIPGRLIASTPSPGKCPSQGLRCDTRALGYSTHKYTDSLGVRSLSANRDLELGVESTQPCPVSQCGGLLVIPATVVPCPVTVPHLEHRKGVYHEPAGQTD